MKIEDLGNIPLAERRFYPYAVAHDGEVIRFASKPAAELYALMLPEGEPRLFVALTDIEWSMNPVIYGWREVSYFAVEVTS